MPKAPEPKVSQPQSQPVNSAPKKKPATTVRFPANSKPPLGRTPPASPASKPENRTAQPKGGAKPTQAVLPLTVKKTAAKTRPAEDAPAANGPAETAAEAPGSVPQEPPLTAPVLDPVVPAAGAPAEMVTEAPPPSVPQELAPVASVPDPTVPAASEAREWSPALPPPDSNTPAEAPAAAPEQSSLAPVPDTESPEAHVPEPPLTTPLPQETPEETGHTPPSPVETVPARSPNDDDDQKEREGSHLISVLEMSGTTQPTEDSRPGSGGPAGGSPWRAGGALLSELDSEEVSGSQQGASELSAPGVLEGTESMDDLGDGSLKGAIDTEGASAGSPDFEKVPDIPANDFEEDEDDEEDRVCDMDVGSERADEPHRPRHDNDVEDDDDEEDEDVEMASEGITESGLESYGNADEDDFVEEERLDNLNRVGQHPPPPPLLPSAPAAQWDQPNPLAHPWSEAPREEDGAAGSPLADPWQADSQTPTQAPAQAWLELGLGAFARENQDQPQSPEARSLEGKASADPQGLSAPRVSLSGTLSSRSSTPEEQPEGFQAAVFSSRPELNDQDLEKRDGEDEEEAETLPADDLLGGPATAPASNPSSSSSASEDELSDTEGEVQLDGSSEQQPASQRCLSTVEEAEEPDVECAVEDTTPPSATSLASYGYDSATTASNSNALSAGESCIRSPGIFSLEELPDEPKHPGHALQPQPEPRLSEQPYIDCGKPGEEPAGQDQEEEPGPNPPAAPGLFQLPEDNPDDPQPPYYSAICEKTENSFAVTSDVLTVFLWQQELQQANKGQAALLSPSSGLCTIYEALESGDEEEGPGGRKSNQKKPGPKAPHAGTPDRSASETSEGNRRPERPAVSPTPPPPDSPETPDTPPRDGSPSGTPEQPSPPDLDWGKKVDMVQQLINQTLLLNREGCSSLLLLPGGAGGTLSPLESSLWPSLLPPLTPPSATVTSVSSFSPETTGSSPQEEWTVVELETHH
ncbi:unnamed protein product [Tetraodon nigroviridis]|uniref:Chromosome 18 SCAF14786, whole genome shotgun sequence n=1 Tax=Tetraodon nigroviridis TaxID=99883 RepID=Q4RZS1_TETNG|nr:unnamed protein product [Tetraodon nigroviridis]